MEDATKALIMAASILIALVIISAILLVFNNLSNYQKVNEEIKRDAKVIEFNNQFETYNRTDVRGSDIFSLINKVLDYNERQSYVGGEGADLGYKPITLTIDLNKNINDIQVPNNDVTSRILITDKNYVIDTSTNKFNTTKNFGKIIDEISNIENSRSGKNDAKLSQSELTELTIVITSVFLSDNSTDSEKALALKKFNDITGRNIKLWNINTIGEGSQIRQDVYKYYEYIQFKRTYFDCTKDTEGKTSGVEYDNNGRITSMYFVGNGKVE